MPYVADNRNINANDLVDRAWVNVDVGFLRIRREGRDQASDPVIKTRTDVDHQVTIMHRHIGFIKPVHAKHAHPVLARPGIGTKPHEGGSDWEASGIHELAQQLACRWARVDHTSAGIKHRAFCSFHQRDQFGDLGDVTLELWIIVGCVDLLLGGIGARGELGVLWNVDKNRTRTARTRDVEGVVDRLCQRVGLFGKPVVFGAGAGDANGVRFLEGVRADHKGRNLTGQHNNRDRVQQRVGQAGHSVCCAGARCHQRNANFTSRARISFGRVNRALFVTHQNVFDVILLKDLVVDR